MRYVIFLLFSILLMGSFAYAQERILFCDASFILTEILNNHSLRIQENRYGSFITQMVPYLSGEMHLPIKTIVLLYSLSFNAFYLTVAAVILFRFKNNILGLLMAFYYVLIVTDTYFWTNNELHQAIAWMFLLFGFVLDFKKRTYHFVVHSILFLVLAFLSFFTHPLIILTFPFLWLFVLSNKSENPYTKKEAFILSGIIIITGVVKFVVMSQGGYDTKAMAGATRISILDVLNSFTSPMAETFSKKLITQYYFVPLLFILGTATALKRKHYKQLLLTIVFLIGYFVAACLTFKDFVPFYTESEWMPFSIIACSLFVFYTFPHWKPKFAIPFIGLIFLVRLSYIAASSQKFVDRKEWILSNLDKMDRQNIKKGYVLKNPEADSILMMDWGLPTESLLASSLRGDTISRTFFVDNLQNAIHLTSIDHTIMVGSFGPWHYKYLNPNYFMLDTINAYQKIQE